MADTQVDRDLRGRRKPFDPLAVPLQGGVGLIEANAGCGKTWALTDLYLRLILERGLAPRNILVVSFTVAATDELKDRIRKRLVTARRSFTGALVDDPLIEALACAYRSNGTLAAALSHIENALYSFDEAAIYTIHGFCLRLLTDFAFECGGLFELETLDTQGGLIAAIIDDHYRRGYYIQEPEFVRYALERGKKRSRLQELLRKALQSSYLQIRPPAYGVKQEEITARLVTFRQEIASFRQVWETRREVVRQKLMAPGLNQKMYGPGKTDRLVDEVTDFLAGVGPFFPLPDNWEKISRTYLESKTNKGKITPEDEVFCRAQLLFAQERDLEAFFQACLHDQLLGLIERARGDAAKRRATRQELTFDDLQHKVEETLAGPEGEKVARAVRSRYQAALIDEFQDTDKTQYAIFEKIFAAPGINSFYIGDPKQAIYSFRGADIFSYLQAAGQTPWQYQKTVNRRSSSLLIKAVNRIFTRRPDPFVHPGIHYQPSSAPQGEVPEELELPDLTAAPFVLWYLAKQERPPDGVEPVAEGKTPSPWGVTRARPRVARAVAAEIKRLLELSRRGRAKIEGRPLEAKDIAVLVRKNREAGLIQETLTAQGIKSTYYSVGNIFHTEEAREIRLLLAAVAAPGEESRLWAALATRLLGKDGPQLEIIRQDAAQRDAWMAKFRRLNEIAGNQGFFSMFHRLLADTDAHSRMFSFEDGERMATNTFQLMELLHLAQRKRHFSLSGLLDHLEAKIREAQQDPSAAGAEKEREEQLRLDSDQAAVRIVTIHKSKGLEYPIVFCPFSWGASDRQQSDCYFHDPESAYRPTFYLQEPCPDRYLAWSREEELAEECRLLYVGLTRAKYRCYFVWGHFKNMARSAPAYLLHGGRVPDEKDFLADLQELAAGYEDCLEVRPLPDLDLLPLAGPERRISHPLVWRRFGGAIDYSWRVTSATHIMTDFWQRPAREKADYGEEEASHPGGDERREPMDAPDPQAPAVLPPGARTGTMLHDILKAIDFTQVDSPQTRELVTEKLFLHGFDVSGAEEIINMLGRVTSRALDGRELRLSRVERRARVEEMPFYYPLEHLEEGRLKEIFGRYARVNPLYSRVMERLMITPVHGFMRGFIDLVFFYQRRYYLLDWKSNYLGPQKEDYRPERIAREMVEALYVFQYLVYTIAVDRYLALRIPAYRYEEHFGGVYYLFLRGIYPDERSGGGVYFDLPPAQMIRELRETLNVSDK